MTAPAAPPEPAAPAAIVASLDGGGCGWCYWCGGRLDFSWRVRYTDGTSRQACSVCVPAVGSIKGPRR